MDSSTDRKLQRAQLIATRNALKGREQLESALQARVADWLRQADINTLGIYFPVYGEPDLQTVIAQWLKRDARRVAALPVISDPDNRALEYHAWKPDAPMRAGGFGIPVPAQGRVVKPKCLLIPCVGFDEKRFRLGYGGGYYDRMLANLAPRPIAVGIAFEASKLESINPRPHDVQLDAVITEAAQY